MANPNIAEGTTLRGHTVCRQLNTTVSTGIITCPSDTIYRINAVYAANIDGDAPCDVTVSIFDGVESVSYPVSSTITVPPDSTLTVITKDAPVYLNESDELRAGASANGDLNIIVSFDEIS